MRSNILRKDSFKKRTFILSFLILLVCLSVGFAYLSQVLKVGTSARIGKNTWDVHFANVVVREGSVNGSSTIGSDKISITSIVELNNPKEFYEIYVYVVNSGSMDAKLENIVNTILTESQKKYLNYTVTYSDYVVINKNDLLKAGEKETIRVLVEMKDVVDASYLPSEAVDLVLETKLNYVQNEGEGVERSNNSLYNQIVKETQPDTNINFGAISSDTNGKGVYTLSKTSNTAYPVYYYRGEVENNNVIFANFCWKIIRTTNTGGVKLIYNGTPSNGVCNNTGDAAEIGKSVYNQNEIEAKYVGYMYDNNTVDSTIKGAIDEWFATNLIDYQTYLEDTPYYNERDYVEGVGFPISYALRQRIWGIRTDTYPETVPKTTIKLGATNKEDIFTVSSEIGNGALTYPVGLITSDEVVMAGGRGYIDSKNNGENSNYYLYTGSWYWTISSHSFHSDSIAYMIRVGSEGRVHSVHASNNGGLRPVIALQPSTAYIGGSGTANSPYYITN